LKSWRGQGWRILKKHPPCHDNKTLPAEASCDQDIEQEQLQELNTRLLTNKKMFNFDSCKQPGTNLIVNRNKY